MNYYKPPEFETVNPTFYQMNLADTSESGLAAFQPVAHPETQLADNEWRPHIAVTAMLEGGLQMHRLYDPCYDFVTVSVEKPADPQDSITDTDIDKTFLVEVDNNEADLQKSIVNIIAAAGVMRALGQDPTIVRESYFISDREVNRLEEHNAELFNGRAYIDYAKIEELVG